MNKYRKNLLGFTIIELMIATAVFSVILLISLTGFLQIGQIFYKGVTVTRTQEAARSALDSLSSDVRFATAISQSAPQSTGSGTSKYFCAGNNRYTYNEGKMVNSSNHNFSSEFGLVKDRLPTTNSCASPFNSTAPFNNPQELLGNKMRVGALSVNRLPGSDLDNLYTISVIIAYGNDDILQNPTTANVKCDSSLTTSQYCYVADLKTTVRRGFN